MAKRKCKKRKTTRTKKRASGIDLTIVTLIILSILLAVLIYGKSGVVGIKLNEILGGMMGIIKYVLPIGIFAVAIKLACADNEYISSKLIQYAILLIGFSVLISVFQINSAITGCVTSFPLVFPKDLPKNRRILPPQYRHCRR